MIRYDIKKTDFYNELPKEKQKEYFDYKYQTYYPAIDNIYYSIYLRDDFNDNPKLHSFFSKLETIKKQVLSDRQPVEYGNTGLLLDGKSFNIYKYCFTNPDYYDIFVIDYLPNNDTPRILVQIRAFGLWLQGAEQMLAESYKHVESIFNEYNCQIIHCRENRIDYCYHTNAISNPEKVFKDKKLENEMHSTMQRWHQTGRQKSIDGKTKLYKDYIAFGNRSSNNVFIRLYNKALEVIEQGYKGFFFELWYKYGLISFYDKYCLEYACIERNYDYIHKAKLKFYLEYGNNSLVKREFEIALNDKNMTAAKYEELASAYMPEITKVLNIEFETKRKFYYYSDNFIDSMLKCNDRPDIPAPLNRLYKIIDNKALFLDYLTSTTLRFTKIDNKYSDWWQRLRSTKLKGINPDSKLIREYSKSINEKIVMRRMINSVASKAVYADNIETNFLEDISDIISNLNDNTIHNMNIALYGDSGEIINDLNSKLLDDYGLKKQIKETHLKNRKKNANQN